MGLVWSWALIWIIRRLRQRRPDFKIGLPVANGVLLRLLVVGAINATGSLQSQLRGGDEQTFLFRAHELISTGASFLPHGMYQLQTVVFALQLKLGDLSTTALRVTQIGIATLGIILLVASVYDLAGPRAARLAAWLLAFEPASLFFNSEIHKEPLMTLASGLVVFGCTKMWKRYDLTGVLLAGVGGLIAVETRAYAGWFLVGAAVLVFLHAALRRLDRPGRALPVVYAVSLALFLAAPTLLNVTSNQSLQTLQRAQTFTTQLEVAGGTGSDNLADESVDFSSRGAVFRNLPRRLFDLIFKPYPWQVHDTSQRLGAVASIIALVGLALLLRYAWRNRGRVLGLTAPILYPLLFLLVAYSLSAGNAGTGFRYRTHLVVLGAAMLVVLREHAQRALAERREPAFARRDPEPLGSAVL